MNPTIADQLYSWALLAGVSLCSLGAAAGTVALLRTAGHRPPVALVAFTSLWASVAGSAFSGLSFLAHLAYGHGAASSAPMTMPQFIGNHPAYLVATGLFCVGFCGWWVSSKRSVAGGG